LLLTLLHVKTFENRLDAFLANGRSMTAEEKRLITHHLRSSWADLNTAWKLAERHQNQWPELTADLDQSLTRLTQHLALTEALRVKGER
jgi:hypothetical protein